MTAIKWLTSLGEPLANEDGFIQVQDWKECEECFTQSEWEDTTLDMRNSITSFLSTEHPDAYLNWNDKAKEALLFLNEEIMPTIESIDVQFEDKETFYSCIRWDLLGCFMENSYKEFNVPQHFTLELLSIYKQGKFPCGWQGKWPNGKILVF